MRLSAQAVRAAIATHIDRDLAEALELAPVVEDSELGELILTAMGFGSKDPALSSVHLSSDDGRAALLDASEALTHPLLSPWIGRSLIAALTVPIVAGARLMLGAPGAPELATVTVRHVKKDVLSGESLMAFTTSAGMMTALASYGETLDPTPLIGALRFNAHALIDAAAAMLPGQVECFQDRIGAFEMRPTASLH